MFILQFLSEIPSQPFIYYLFIYYLFVIFIILLYVVKHQGVPPLFIQLLCLINVLLIVTNYFI